MNSPTQPCRKTRGERRGQWFEVLRQSRVAILSTAIVVLAFSCVPQAQDVLRSLAQPGASWQIIGFEILLWIWAFSVWGSARFLLGQDFEALRADTPENRRTARDLWGESFIPRFLGAIGLVGVGTAMLLATGGIETSDGMRYELVRWIGQINICAGVLFYYLLRSRQSAMEQSSIVLRQSARYLSAYLTSLLTRMRQSVLSRTITLVSQGIGSPALQEALVYQPLADKIVWFSEYPRLLRWLMQWSLALAGILWLLVIFSIQSIAPWLGAAVILSLGCVFLTVLGTALVWLGERWHWPMLLSVFIYLMVVGLWNDNHAVRELETRSPQRPDFTAQELYTGWLGHIEKKYGSHGKHPMFIVAAAGGGIKAAYWTASVLGELQDRNPAFAEHTLIISPVSGGTLGTLVFVNLGIQPNRGGSLADQSRKILSRDFLSPALGSLLFIDLPARFSPFPNLLPDRAMALEQAWERAWPDAAGGKSPFAAGYATLQPYELSHAIPTLLINGTSVESGQRILTTHLNLGTDFPDCLDTFAIRPNDLRMSTAAMMSARFTYVSPAGTLSPNDRVVDGGYFDNSGASTALQFYRNIEPLMDRGKVIPVFIQIDNDYVATAALGRKQLPDQELQEDAREWRFFPEIQAPILALLKTRNAHARAVAEQVKREFDPAEHRYLLFTFSTPGDVKAPLGWFLSHAAKQELTQQLENAANDDNFQVVMQLLQPFNERVAPGLVNSPKARKGR